MKKIKLVHNFIYSLFLLNFYLEASLTKDANE